MKHFVLIAWAIIAGLRLSAQSPFFIYVQSEPATPFSVSCKGQTLRSSQTGYLIVSNLTDTVLQLAVSFPDKKQPDQLFVVRTQGSDQGFLLKDYGDKGWGLLDWRQLLVTYAERPTNARAEPIGATNKEDFALLLAKASGDSSLLAETPKPIVEEKPAPDSKPLLEPKPVETPETKPVAEEKPAPDSKPAVIPVPSYCTSILTEAEFKGCLTKTEEAKSETSKVAVVRAFINGRCFTIEQVKTLAMLLATDEIKYDFLLEFWTQTAERERYLSLVSVFGSSGTADRFKEMFQ
jgi:hypothetical protein